VPVDLAKVHPFPFATSTRYTVAYPTSVRPPLAAPSRIPLHLQCSGAYPMMNKDPNVQMIGKATNVLGIVLQASAVRSRFTGYRSAEFGELWAASHDASTTYLLRPRASSPVVRTCSSASSACTRGCWCP